MKRRSGRNPINFVHAIHICNFVFAIQSRRHATRNRFPLDSSNGYVYFSLLSPASSTVPLPPRPPSVSRQMTANFYSSDCICNSHARESPPFLLPLLSRHLLPRFSRIPFHPSKEYLSIPRCIQFSCLSFFFIF